MHLLFIILFIIQILPDSPILTVEDGAGITNYLSYLIILGNLFLISGGLTQALICHCSAFLVATFAYLLFINFLFLILLFNSLIFYFNFLVPLFSIRNFTADLSYFLFANYLKLVSF